ncbi:MAG: tRNA (N6-threonylcarbamoyladenosine(37)-N6)-methyltransferase TrmO [Oscillospiraceae bacterium]|nr:tRNA (N6-threonylcarbamoyladenosine(37)-N6)-methyltransferase TrmO [Oscillospiraceae bacterium]
MPEHKIAPVAYIHTDLKEKFGIPRQSGLVGELEARIVFVPEYRNPDALRGIEGFSRLWLLFDFSEAHRDEWSPTVRPPRLGGNERVGVFASRSPFRPNNIGLSCVVLDRVEHTDDDGDVLIVKGVDLLDMTPIYDIKPYLPYADSYPDARAGYTDERERVRLEVEYSDEAISVVPENKRAALIGCIAEDPRPSYQKDETRVYSMRFAGFDVHFTVSGKCARITSIDVEK